MDASTEKETVQSVAAAIWDKTQDVDEATELLIQRANYDSAIMEALLHYAARNAIMQVKVRERLTPVEPSAHSAAAPETVRAAQIKGARSVSDRVRAYNTIFTTWHVHNSALPIGEATLADIENALTYCDNMETSYGRSKAAYLAVQKLLKKTPNAKVKNVISADKLCAIHKEYIAAGGTDA